MTEEEWSKDFARCLGLYLSGDGLRETDMRGRPVRDASFLLLFNAHHDAIAFRLPRFEKDEGWFAQIDTAYDNGRPELLQLQAGAEYPLQGRSLALLRRLEATA